MAGKIIRRHPVLAGIVLVPITFVLAFFTGWSGLMLLDSMLIPTGLEAGFLYRLFVAPIGGLVAALIGCFLLISYLYESRIR